MAYGRGGRWLARFQNWLESVALLPLGISSVTLGFGFVLAFTGRIENYVLLPIAQAVIALPLVIRTLVPAMRAIHPRQREAAALLGAGPWRVFATVDLPVLWRNLGYAASLAFAISLGEFGASSFLASPTYQTLPVLIGRLLSRPGANNFEIAIAAAVLLAAMAGVAMALAALTQPRAARVHATNTEGKR